MATGVAWGGGGGGGGGGGAYFCSFLTLAKAATSSASCGTSLGGYIFSLIATPWDLGAWGGGGGGGVRLTDF